MNIKPKISQHKLRRYLELEAAAKEFAELDVELKEAVKSNASVQPGPLIIHSKWNKGKRYPAWKEHTIHLAEKFKKQLGVEDGEAYANGIIDSTTPRSDTLSISVVDTRLSIQNG